MFMTWVGSNKEINFYNYVLGILAAAAVMRHLEFLTWKTMKFDDEHTKPHARPDKLKSWNSDVDLYFIFIQIAAYIRKLFEILK